MGSEMDDGSAALKELTVGTTIDGRYVVDAILGEGAMGIVVSAKHVHLGERVALKFLRYRAQSADDDFRSRFKREAKVSAMLRNEHVTRVIDVGIWRDRVPYMVMDYLAGTDLRRLLKEEGPLPIARALDLVAQLCVGISEAHAKGVVHRDLKPSNIFVVQRPDGSDLVKILDFGISKWTAGEAELDELTKTGIVLGSPKYMAPEQLVGSSEVDARADVWSIGAILYQLLGGKAPFDFPTFTRLFAEVSSGRPPPSLSALRPEVPPALEAVVMKCFERNPANRVQNVADLAGDLLDAVQAPFAAELRQRIESTLSPASGEIPITSDEPPPLKTGSMSPTLAEGNRPSITPTGQVVPSEPPRRRRAPLVIGALLVTLGGAAVMFVTRGDRAPVPAQAAAPVAPATSSPVQPPDPSTASPGATAPPAAASSAPSPQTSAATVAPSATSTAVVVAPPSRGHHPPAAPPAATPVAVAPVTPAPAPPPPVQPAPAAQPKPPPAADPLGDRQ
jgi:serine/threonine-protein kinase